MPKMDWFEFEATLLGERPVVLDFQKVAHAFNKVAFDVYREKEGDTKLWELREGDDGKKYLYALYDEAPAGTLKSESNDVADEELPAKKASVWHAAGDSTAENVTLFYKNHPIHRFASTTYGFNKSDIDNFIRYVSAAAAEPAFIDGLKTLMPAEKQVYVSSLLASNGE